MRVLFLDDDLTRARLTKGWFRKLQTEVYRDHAYWYYSKSEEFVGAWLDANLDSARARERSSRTDKRRRVAKAVDWTPVATAKLPEARVHGRNS